MSNYYSEYRQNTDHDFVFLIDITLSQGTRFLFCQGSQEGSIIVQDKNGHSLYYKEGGNNSLEVELFLKPDPVSFDFNFYLPVDIRVIPADLDWSAGTVELSIYSPGKLYEERRVLSRGIILSYAYGDVDELVSLSCGQNTEDQGQILPENTRISSDNWSDVGIDPSSTSENTNGFQQALAYESDGKYYGEIIGKPRYAQMNIVEDCVVGESGVDFKNYTWMITSDQLLSTEDRSFVVLTPNRAYERLFYPGGGGSHIPPVGASSIGIKIDSQVINGGYVQTTNSAFASTDANPDRHLIEGDPFIFEIGITNFSSLANPSDDVEAPPSSLTENIPYVGQRIAPGDHIGYQKDSTSAPNAEDYRIITEIIDAPFTGSVNFESNFLKHSSEPTDSGGASYSADTPIIGYRYSPKPGSASSGFLLCSTYGGIASAMYPGALLRTLPEVLSRYHYRSSGINVDIESIQALEMENLYIDGQILEGDISPTEWIDKEILPLFPLVRVYNGKGLRYEILDYQRTDYSVSLNLGREGSDGDRQSQITSNNLQVSPGVVNDLWFRYSWNALSEAFNAKISNKDLFDYSLAPTTRVAFQAMNNRARESRILYGQKRAIFESKFINHQDTAMYIAASKINRFWKPRKRINYELNRKFNFLELNSPIKITDTNIGIIDKPYLITAINYATFRGPIVTLEEMD